MKIKIVPIGSSEEKKLRKIILDEWPDRDKFQKDIQEYSKELEYITQAVILFDNEVIGGFYITNHPKEIKFFKDKIPEVKNKNAVMFEDIVIEPKHRGKGFGKKLIMYCRKRYLKKFDIIVFSSRMLEVQDFYPKLGAKILSKTNEKEFNDLYQKEVLKEGTIFMFS